ncbi:hypothetical protein ARSEF1564_010125 [Beauveria bassiana]
MAATALNPVLIPGLHAPPGREDMEKATLLYNSLPDDKNQPEISVFHLNNIKELIVKYGRSRSSLCIVSVLVGFGSTDVHIPISRYFRCTA